MRGAIAEMSGLPLVNELAAPGSHHFRCPDTSDLWYQMVGFKDKAGTGCRFRTP